MNTIIREQQLPIPISEAWTFFSAPQNLSRITPDWLGFTIRSGAEKKMYQGQIITYWITPFPGIRSSWVTEITHVNEPNFFVDEQRLGPYAFWHHQHSFEAAGEATLIRDEVNYAVPLGLIGTIIDLFWINKRVNSIFDYRYKVLKELFQN
jgi:ligand-binding SRPBCC domain-containing protein